MPQYSKAQTERLREVCKTVGRFIEYWGFKRAHGEVWVFLYVSEHPVPLEEVQQFLGVSRAMGHLILGELVSYGLVERVKEAGARKHFYQVTDDVWRCISQVLKSREHRLIVSAKKSIENFEEGLPRSTPAVVYRRVRFLKNLCQYALHVLTLFIQGSMLPGRVEDNLSRLWKRIRTITPDLGVLRIKIPRLNRQRNIERERYIH